MGRLLKSLKVKLKVYIDYVLEPRIRHMVAAALNALAVAAGLYVAHQVHYLFAPAIPVLGLALLVLGVLHGSERTAAWMPLILLLLVNAGLISVWLASQTYWYYGSAAFYLSWSSPLAFTLFSTLSYVAGYAWGTTLPLRVEPIEVLKVVVEAREERKEKKESGGVEPEKSRAKMFPSIKLPKLKLSGGKNARKRVLKKSLL